MSLRTPLFILAATVLALGACDKQSTDDSKLLANVNGETLTQKDFDIYARVRQQGQGQPPTSDREKKAALDEMIDRVLLTQEAARQKLDQDPETVSRLKRIRENLLIQELVRRHYGANPISDDELKKRFQEESEKTHKTQYKVRHILVQTENEATEVIKKLKGGANINALAKEKSLDQMSARQGGDLGWVDQNTGFVPEFFTALTTMKKGDVSSTPVKTEFGFHVIRVDDTRPLKFPSADEFMADREARARLMRQMQDEKLNAMVKDLRAKAKIDVK